MHLGKLSQMNKYTLIIGPVQKGVPIPDFIQAYPLAKALSELEIGDCRDFDYPDGSFPRTFQKIILKAAKAHGITITTRKKDNASGIRVWRIADRKRGVGQPIVHGRYAAPPANQTQC